MYWQVLLLMASALKFPLSESAEGGVLSILADKLRAPHLNIAEITEMIHVSIVLWLSLRADMFSCISQAVTCHRLQAFCMMMF